MLKNIILVLIVGITNIAMLATYEYLKNKYEDDNDWFEQICEENCMHQFQEDMGTIEDNDENACPAGIKLNGEYELDSLCAYTTDSQVVRGLKEKEKDCKRECVSQYY